MDGDLHSNQIPLQIENLKNDARVQSVSPSTPSNQTKRKCTLFTRLVSDLWTYKRAVIVILTPVLFSPLLFLGSSEATCGFCVILMSFYWLFEVMPLAATALIPTFLFPALGVLPSKVVCTAYIPDTNFLFIGGLIVAVAVERCGLHQRIALRVLTIVGSQPKWIMLGFMAVTAFLSMWISNTATTAMMVPIAQSVIQELVRTRNSIQIDNEEELATLRECHENPEAESSGEELVAADEVRELPPRPVTPPPLGLPTLSIKQQNTAKGVLICIAFAANIGGTGTVTGSPPNLVTIGILQKTYAGADTGLNFASWIQFAAPLMLISVVVCWVTLVVYFLGPRTLLCRRCGQQKVDGAVSAVMRAKYDALPRMSFAEGSVLISFAFLLLMWIFRDPKEIPGFGALFKTDASGASYFTDASSAMFVAVLLFLLPEKLPDFLCTKKRNRSHRPRLRGSLMDWQSMQEKFPWSVVLLLGGGFALAAGVKASGLSASVSDMLRGLETMNIVGIQFVCVFITMAISNICSNTVTASIFVPIVAGLAESVGVHPLELVLPVALACSFAFCLPVATPPNAIVFASGLLTVPDMLKSGLLITFVSALLIVLNHQTYARLALPLDEFPDWANSTRIHLT